MSDVIVVQTTEVNRHDEEDERPVGEN